MELHERIKCIREEQGMSQYDLAKAMGYKDRSAVSRIELGTMDMPVSRLYQMADALGVSVAELMGIEASEGFKVTFPERRLLLKYRSLNREQQAFVSLVLDREFTNAEAE